MQLNEEAMEVKRVDNGPDWYSKITLLGRRKTKNKNTDLGESCPFSLLAMKI